MNTSTHFQNKEMAEIYILRFGEYHQGGKTSLNPDQVLRSVGPDLGSSLSTDEIIEISLLLKYWPQTKCLYQ